MEENKMGFENNSMAMNDILLDLFFEQVSNETDDMTRTELFTSYIDYQHEKIQEFEKKVHHMGSTIDFLHGELYELATEEEYEEFLKVWSPYDEEDEIQ